MSGLGLVLSIAKDALAAQQYSIDVTAHNIANVNTPGYSRQRPVYEAKEPAPYGGLLLGRGVDTTQIVRVSDQFIENRLMQQKSSLLSSKEMENYMQVVEGFFNENSEISISEMLAEFWNFWHDIANNPSGASERIAIYEHSVQLAEQFNTLYADLTSLETDLTNAINSGISKINQITNEISILNGKIVGMEASNIANDLRDQRNTLVSELSEYLGVNTFEQDNGSLTVVTVRGCILVHGNSSYDLELGGANGDRVKWQGSGGDTIDITNYITSGKLDGWLNMRDEIIAKYKLDLDALAKEFIWMVNQQHSQGVGLELFQPSSSITGSYKTNTTLGDLKYGGVADGYVDYSGTFELWIGDANGENLQKVLVDLDDAGDPIDATSTLTDLATSINNQIGAVPLAGVTASVSASGDAIVFTTDGSHTFGFADDASHILAALGINTFFTGATAGGMGVSSKIGSDKNFIAVAQIDSTGNYATGDNANARAIADLQYTSTDIAQWTCDRINGNTEGSVNATIETYYHAMVGTIGIASASISRSTAFNEVMVDKLGETRDSISAVSLDEEMTNLIKFQHAYTAAAQLISVSDEMLDTLLNVK